MDIFDYKRKYIMIAAIITFLCCMLMIIFPSTALYSARNAIQLWMTDVLPALLPFFICANFLQRLGVVRLLSPGIFPFMMSVLSGYPMGACIIGELKRNRDISLNEAKQMMAYCSTSGPAFMISAVGAGMLSSDHIGLVIALAHYSGALLNGILYKVIFTKKHGSKSMKRYVAAGYMNEERGTTLQEALTDAISVSLRSLGIILAYIVLFMFMTDVLTIGGGFDAVERPWIEVLLKGLIEMTVGCESAAGCIDISDKMKCILCSAMISWGGLSIMGQTMSMLTGTEITMRYIFITKLTHTLFSTAAAFVLASFVL